MIGLLFPHHTYGRKGLSSSVAACHHHASAGMASALGAFSSRDRPDCILDFFLAGWSVEICVCLNLWQAGNSFDVDICWYVKESTKMLRPPVQNRRFLSNKCCPIHIEQWRRAR